MNTTLDTVIFDITPMAAFLDRARGAAQSGLPAQAAHISFETPEHLWQVLGGKRWAILRAMTGAGPIGVRELARRVGRDVRAVHADAAALLDAGIIDRTSQRKLLFPYRHVKVQFALDGIDVDGPSHATPPVVAAPVCPRAARPVAAAMR